MSPNGALREKVHQLWDGLADFDAAQVDKALDYLLEGLCALSGAQNADWIGVVRLSDARSDPARGWRLPIVHFLHQSEKLAAAMREQLRRFDQEVINDAAANMFAQSGQFRASRLADLMPPEWFESEVYRRYYQDADRGDVVYVCFPVNEDAESYFGIFRAVGQPRFTAQERDLVAYALRGVKWFHRQLLLSHGLLIANAPVTPAERRVLQGLLTGQAEREIAADLGQSYHTTHEYVSAIFRKFGVKNRPALMALWLGNGT